MRPRLPCLLEDALLLSLSRLGWLLDVHDLVEVDRGRRRRVERGLDDFLVLHFGSAASLTVGIDTKLHLQAALHLIVLIPQLYHRAIYGMRNRRGITVSILRQRGRADRLAI